MRISEMRSRQLDPHSIQKLVKPLLERERKKKRT